MQMQFAGVDHGKAFDWGETSAEYAQYRDIYPPVFYKRAFLDAGIGAAGQTCLDLGTGTGILPRVMASYGAKWYGADITEQQILYARKLAAKQGLTIEFSVAPAEDTGFPDGMFDVVTACQCFGYFDKSRALPEICRILKPHGHFLVLYMAWLPQESEIARKAKRLCCNSTPIGAAADFSAKRKRRPCGRSPILTVYAVRALRRTFPLPVKRGTGACTPAAVSAPHRCPKRRKRNSAKRTGKCCKRSRRPLPSRIGSLYWIS